MGPGPQPRRTTKARAERRLRATKWQKCISSSAGSLEDHLYPTLTGRRLKGLRILELARPSAGPFEHLPCSAIMDRTWWTNEMGEMNMRLCIYSWRKRHHWIAPG